MILKLLLIPLCSFLNWAGGYHWLWCRRFVMSFVIAFYCALRIKVWWIFFPIMVPFAVCLSLHDQNRGVWCSLDALGASFALLAMGYIHWYFWATYCALNYGIGAIFNKNKAGQLIEDMAEGAGLGSLVLFI